MFPLIDPDSAVARNIACVGPALLLTALILHRLSPRPSPSPARRRLVTGLAAVGVVLMVIPPFLLGLANDESLLGPTMLTMLGLLAGFGTLMSLIPATVGVFALAGTTALLRAAATPDQDLIRT
ncbi:hypothetical protein [Kineosporia sp. NBRC 101677]|uniref:hypothetical protein n=1 Tax=Kineosporia sp. NBRC 101677 TaxID=3032197 RepID=UPI00255767AC|nr:hypothetical protein [Kineosporia sp. NBRC 101677]